MKHDVAELLPFYANGTLDAADRARVETELATCSDCTAELRELQALATALRTRADAAPSPPASILDDALARIATPTISSAATRLQTAWWGTPARYATAAALVVGIGAAAAAAYRAHEADLARTQVTATTAADSLSAAVFRPNNGQLARVSIAPRPAGEPAPKTNVLASGTAQGVAAESVAKQHRLAKKGSLALLVSNVEVSLKNAKVMVNLAGGEVTSLDDTTPPTADTVHEAHLDVEVPADRLDATLDRLATLGAVQNRAIEAEDLDATIVDQEARVTNLRREEDDLRKLMDRGGKVAEILTVQQHLSDVRGQIEELTAQHRHNLHRLATSTISIALTEDRPNAAPAKPGPTARIDGAWHNGLNALTDTVISLLAAIAWCVALAPIPLGIAAAAYAAVYAAARLLKRRPASA